ncbi:MAG: hypothetical protein U9O82_07635 [Thermodesulfobacteriota bacterium]|nr:hypothetical protein [Thermodesulfobacteriota bacterium]
MQIIKPMNQRPALIFSISPSSAERVSITVSSPKKTANTMPRATKPVVNESLFVDIFWFSILDALVKNHGWRKATRLSFEFPGCQAVIKLFIHISKCADTLVTLHYLLDPESAVNGQFV